MKAKPNSSDKNYTKYSVIVIVIFSIIVLSLTLVYHISGDGCWHVSSAKFIARNFRIPLNEPLGRNEPFWSPPLYHIITAVVFYIFSFNENAADFAVKFVSPIFGILSLIFSFLIIKKIKDKKIAFYSVLFLAFVPIFLDYSIFSYVESTLVFFAVLGVYFMINDKIILSSISAGLAILSKYNGVFILPLLLFILYKKNNNEFHKKSAIMIFISMAISSVWFLRNFAQLGNPIWPFLNFVFNGIPSNSFSGFSLSRLIDPNAIVVTYLGLFGVPDGNYRAFSFVSIPYFSLMLAIWAIGTLIFITPLLIGIFRKNNRNNSVFNVWVLSYLILFFIYVLNVGWSVTRMMLPAFTAIAFFWAEGIEKILSKRATRKIFPIILILVCIGFIAVESVKIVIASNSWNFYKEDFAWVKSNTDRNAIFVAQGQCVPYNIDRTSLYATKDNLKIADYIWINQNFNLDRISILDNEKMQIAMSNNPKLVYSNEKTGTKMYSLK